MPRKQTPRGPDEASGKGGTPSERRMRFIDAFLEEPNATKAALKAGFAAPSAHVTGGRLLRHPLVIAALEERRAALREAAGIDAQWVVQRLRLISDRCIQGEPVIDREGNQTGEWKFDAAGANKATELLGKTLGIFRDKVEVTGKDGGPLEVEVSDARQRLADRLRRAQSGPDPTGPS